jgi:hypothetical protein
MLKLSLSRRNCQINQVRFPEWFLKKELVSVKKINRITIVIETNLSLSLEVHRMVIVAIILSRSLKLSDLFPNGS